MAADSRRTAPLADTFAGIALAAGEARRLRPLSSIVPKPLCLVANRELVHTALDRLAGITSASAVNVHHQWEAIATSVEHRAYVSHEVDLALGTAGAVGNLRRWIDGRPTVVVNADTWTTGTLDDLVAAWDGESIRVLVPGGGAFGPTSPVTATLLPAAVAAALPATPAGLYETVWRDAAAEGRLEVVADPAPFHDCGTVGRLHRANMAALDAAGIDMCIDPAARVDGAVTASCVAAGATVRGTLDRCVVFAGATVSADEHLSRAIRVPARWGDRTFLVR